jgi:hypothetical protein
MGAARGSGSRGRGAGEAQGRPQRLAAQRHGRRSGAVTLDGQRLSLATGDCLLVEPCERHRIANTGNAADYKWIAEPGEDSDNQIQPSFATIKGMTCYIAFDGAVLTDKQRYGGQMGILVAF